MEKKFPETIEEIAKEWEDERPIRIMFEDEARFGRITAVHNSWCPKPYRPVCKVLVSQQYVYAYGVVSIGEGKLESLVMSGCNTTTMQIFLEEISSRHKEEKIIMVMDGAGWHKSKDLVIPSNIKILHQLPYSPETNPMEQVWRVLKLDGFYNRIFENLDELEEHLVEEIYKFEHDSSTISSLTSWEWIINAILN